MNKFIRLREDHLEARKAKDMLASNLLGTLIGEVETALKGCDELPEVVVERIAKKFKKGLISAPTAVSEQEILLLEAYLPEQMEESQIIEELNLLGIKEMSSFGQKMGTAMKGLSGKVDGRVLGDIIRMNF